jgi:DNA-directed RNA polymerase specialized sigma24 family protein
MSDNIERNNELYPAVVAGDPAAREAMILNNLGLVVVKAESLIRQMPGIAYLRDDLVSAGNTGLVKAVNQIASGDGRIRMAGVNKWIGRLVTRAMLTLLPREHSVPVPRESRRLARKTQQPIQIPVVFNVIPETLEAFSDLRVVELRDAISACCHSDAERECLRLHEEGYTFREISQQLGIPYSTTTLMFRTLKARILDYWNQE